MDIIFACLKEDEEFKNIIQSTFPEADEVENFSVSGMDEMMYYIVPIAALLLQIADFIWTHFKESNVTEEKLESLRKILLEWE